MNNNPMIQQCIYIYKLNVENDYTDQIIDLRASTVFWGSYFPLVFRKQLDPLPPTHTMEPPCVRVTMTIKVLSSNQM